MDHGDGDGVVIVQKIMTAGARSAAVFDGTNDYLARSTDLTGISDGKQVACSVWLRRDDDAASGNGFTILSQNDGSAAQGFQLTVSLSSSHRPTGLSCDTAGSTNGQFSTADSLPLETWSHLMFSYDLTDANKIEAYLDGVDQSETFGVRVDSNINFTAGRFGIGGRPTGSTTLARWFGGMAELWWTPTYVDLTVEATRLKFRTAAGKPAVLGATGATPTGSQPIIYMRDHGDFSIGRNRGSGGDFTVNGAITATRGPW